MDCGFILVSELKLCDIFHAPLRHPVLAYLSQVSLGNSGPTLGSATGMLFSGFKSILTPMQCVTKVPP
jgi:hypothetical protein